MLRRIAVPFAAAVAAGVFAAPAVASTTAAARPACFGPAARCLIAGPAASPGNEWNDGGGASPDDIHIWSGG